MKNNILLLIVSMIFLVSSGFAEVTTDDFTGSAIGNQWAANPAQFAIQTGLLKNIHPTGWALAVYKNALNPVEASIKWATSSTADGVNAAGFAVFLDKTDYTKANGYFVFVRNTDLILTAITNGQIIRVPELATKSVTVKPKPGDIIKVQYGLVGATREFKFYIGATLVGTVTTTQVHGSTTNHYAGVVAFGQTSGQYLANADDFTVKYPKIKITAPIVSTTWTEGLTYDITWTASDVTGNVNIDYSKDNTTWEPLFADILAANGKQAWTVNKPAQSPVYVRISSVANNLIKDATSFSIIGANPFITLTSPKAGDVWFLNREHEIKWTHSKIQSIKITYKVESDANWYDVVNSVSTVGGSYKWTVPQTIPIPSSGVAKIKIKVEGIFDVTTYTDETEYFDVMHLAVLQVRDTMGEPGKSSNVALRLKNMIEVRGLSFTLQNPDPPLKPVYLVGTTEIPIVKKERVKDFSMTYNYTIAGGIGSLNVLLINLTGKAIPLGDDNILEIPFGILATAAGTIDLTLANVKIIDRNNKEINPSLIIPGKFSFVKPGDINKDNVVNVDDYKILLQFVIGERFQGDLGTPTFDNTRIAADFDADGDLDLYDLMKLWDVFNPAP